MVASICAVRIVEREGKEGEGEGRGGGREGGEGEGRNTLIFATGTPQQLEVIGGQIRSFRSVRIAP